MHTNREKKPTPGYITTQEELDAINQRELELQVKLATLIKRQAAANNLKMCFRCRKPLPREKFARHCRTADGLQHICRKCHSAESHRHNSSVRAGILSLLGGTTCHICKTAIKDSSRAYVTQVVHNPDVPTFPSMRYAYYLKRPEQAVKHLKILCNDCRWARLTIMRRRKQEAAK